MAITVDEGFVPAALIFACAALLSLLAVRGCLYAMGRVLVHYRCRLANPATECVVLLACLVLTYLCLSFNSGLSLLVAGLSVCTAAALSWSASSFRVLCVGGFTVLSLLVPLALSRGVEVSVVPQGTPWVSRYAGEHVRWGMDPSGVTAAAAAAQMAQFIYHDRVTVRDVVAGDSDKGESGEVHLSRRRAARVLGGSLTWLQPLMHDPPWSPPSRNESAARMPADGRVSSRLLYSIGDDTRVTAYGAASASSPTLAMDRIALLGDGSTLENARLRCLAPVPAPAPSSTADVLANGTPSPPEPRSLACLFLAPSVRLRNVSLDIFHETTHAAAAAAVCTVRIDKAANCDEAAAQLLASAARACAADVLAAPVLHCLDTAKELATLEAALEAAAAPAAFRRSMPVAAAVRHVLPAQATKVRALLVHVMDGVVLPTAHALAQAVPVATQGLMSVAQWSLPYVEAVGPYARQGCVSASQMAAGLLCGPPPPATESIGALNTTAAAAEVQNSTPPLASTSSPSSPTLTGVPAPPTRHAAGWLCRSSVQSTSREYAWGAQLHQSLAAALATAVDALELVPGVWSAYRWAWDAEVRLTVWCVRGLTTAARFLVEVLPVPMARVCWSVVKALGRLGGVLVALSGELLRRLSASSLAVPVHGAVRWLLAEELREMRWEWRLVQHTVVSGTHWAADGLQVVWRVLSIVYGVLRAACHLYGATTFTIHFLVVLVQTAALLVSMRDEIRTLMQHEEEESRRRAHAEDTSVLLQPTNALARLWTRKVERHTAVSRLQGVMLFIKSHHIECVRYAVFHLVVFSTLLGFSFLPFTRKLYRLTLHVILPWYSSYLYLSFRCVGGAPPSRRRVLGFTLAKAVVTVVLQCTVGDVLFRLLRDLFVALCLLAVSVVAIWAWPHRHHLIKDVAEVISDSLNPTPQRPRATSVTPRAAPASPPPAPPTEAAGVEVSAVASAADEGDRDVARVILHATDEEEEDTAEAQAAASTSPEPQPQTRSPARSSHSSSLFTEDDEAGAEKQEL